MRIDTANAENIADWIRLREGVYTGIDRDFHEREIELFGKDDTKECFLAFANNGHVCGMIEVSLRNVVDGCLTSPVGYIEGIYVEPESRGQGLSKRLLESAQTWCREKGCTEIGTDAELDNAQAQRFHEHMGFQETYRVVEYRKSLLADDR